MWELSYTSSSSRTVRTRGQLSLRLLRENVAPVAALTAVCLIGCTTDQKVGNVGADCPAGTRGLSLALVDSVVLQETDSIFLGNPGASLSVGPNGSFYIPDYASGRLVVFSPQGDLLMTVGRAGAGPGEFQMVGAFGVVTDSLVLYIDSGARRVNVFHRSGSFRTSIPYNGYLSWISKNRGLYAFGLIDHGSTRAIALRPEGEIDAAVGKPLEELTATMIALPSEYSTYPLLRQWNDAKVVRFGDTTIVAFGGVSYLVRAVGPAPLTDTIRVPACKRRGTPREVLERLFKHSPRGRREAGRLYEKTDQAISGAGGLWRLGDGRFLMWYQDPTLEPGGQVLKGTAFLSLFSADLSRVCVDGRIDAPGIDRPRIGFHDDSVLVLDQVVPADGPSRAVTVIRKYVLKPEGCSWLLTAPP